MSVSKSSKIISSVVIFKNLGTYSGESISVLISASAFSLARLLRIP